MTNVINVGTTDNDGTGDTLRAAFTQINARFNEILGQLTGGDAWAAGVTYTATPVRNWVIESGNAYVAASNHVSGGTFAADFAAGKWLAADSAQILVDLASSSGASLVGFSPTGNITSTDVQDAIAEVATDAAASISSNLTDIQNGTVFLLTGVTGTDTIAGNLTPAITSYVAGQTFRFVAIGANTGAATINVDGLGAKALTKSGSTALVAGDIASGSVVTVTYDGTRFQLASGAGSSGGIDVVFSDGSTQTSAAAPQINALSASVSTNALTIAQGKISLGFRSTTLSSGAVTYVTGTPSNLVVPSGATLGTVGTVQSRLVVLALNNAGTTELAVTNLSGGIDLSETGLISTTAISAAATSSSVVYSTTARTSVAYRVLGYIESTQATAGTWATAPSTVQGVGGQALAAMSSLGYGQTWQNMTSSRAWATTYYNTTGKAIQLEITIAGDGATTSALNLNGSVHTTAVLSSTATTTLYPVISHGEYYSVTRTGSNSIQAWWEKR
jgi:hypothetical protein